MTTEPRGPNLLPTLTREDAIQLLRRLDLEPKNFRDADDPRVTFLYCMHDVDVAACPGSGKTTLLAAKLTLLAEKWPHRTRGICVLSHTNAAQREIEACLRKTSAGARLLEYPHFIGTIHSFVNEYLALPWLRSKGWPVTLIDTDVCQRRRWAKLDPGCRVFLERQRHSPAGIRLADANFNVAPSRGTFRFRSGSATYVKLQTAFRQTTEEGYYCYDDLFIWGQELLRTVPEVASVTRDRFPLLFVDEAQDNSEVQASLLATLFSEGRPAVVQRLGDPNQAIFAASEAEGATTARFPRSGIKLELPSSHRFGQVIAGLADPLGVVPYDLRGLGPSKAGAIGESEERHTILLFDDGSVDKVLPTYAELLLSVFSEAQLNHGSFTAVGHVHRPSGNDSDVNCPRHMAHYWLDYDGHSAHPDASPRSLVGYVLQGQLKASEKGEAFHATELIAEGILRLADSARRGQGRRRRSMRHRYLLEILDRNAELRAGYDAFVQKHAVELIPLTRDAWEDGAQDMLWAIAALVAESELTSDSAKRFVTWKEDLPQTVAPERASDRGNMYAFPRDTPRVKIRVGSIHSVKGETHTATLVCETFWNDHNLEKLKPWLLGGRSGWRKKDGKQQHTRMKAHYVAMTRPTHLLCLAMKRSSFESDGKLDEAELRQLQGRGWNVVFI